MMTYAVFHLRLICGLGAVPETMMCSALNSHDNLLEIIKRTPTSLKINMGPPFVFFKAGARFSRPPKF